MIKHNPIFFGHQTGGNHYQSMKIPPWQYNIQNNLPWAEGEIVKYVSRWRNKGGVADLQKAKDILEVMIAEETQANTVAKHPPIVEYTLTESEMKGLD